MALCFLILLGAIAAFYPILIYATYVLSFITTLILRKNRIRLKITEKQAGIYCGFTAILIVVLFLFIINIWGTPYFFYLRFKPHESIVSIVAWLSLIGVGLTNLLMSIQFSRETEFI
jgi:hypothetical protein